jgi:hypothetical protein
MAKQAEREAPPVAATAPAEPAPDQKPPAPAAADAKAEPKAQTPAEAVAAWERVNLRNAELERREKELAERESKVRDVSARFGQDPLESIRDLARASLGPGATPEEIEEEVADQIYALNLRTTGLEVDKNNPAYLARRNARETRAIKAEMRRVQEQAKLEREMAAKSAAELEHRQKVADATKLVGAAYKELAPNFRYLNYSQQDPAELIVNFVLQEHERTGEVLEIRQAAEALNKHFEQMYRPILERHAAETASASSPPKATEPQGAPPVRPRSLTNADASEGATAHRYTMDEYGRPPPQEVRWRDSMERFLAKQRPG